MPNQETLYRLENSQRAARADTKQIGPAGPEEILPLTLCVRPRAGAPALPDQDHWETSLPGERRFLTSTEFGERYGSDPEDLERVAQFLQSHGIRVVEKNVEQRIVLGSGTVANLEKAFSVTLHRYESDAIDDGPRRPAAGGVPERPMKGRKTTKPDKTVHIGYEGCVHIPAELAGVVEAVFGLDRRRLARRSVTPLPSISPLTPPQVASLYDFPQSTAHIHHETIGLFEFSDPVAGLCGYYPADVVDFFTTPLGIGPGFTPPALTDIGVNGASNSPGGFADIEVALDIQVAGSAAQGAPINVYFTTWDENGWVLAIKRAVHPKPGEKRPAVLSISWGWGEFDTFGNLAWSPAVMDTVNTAFREAAAFGITVFAASGDAGSDAGNSAPNANVNYPASSPWVTAVGGTTIGNVSGSSFSEVTWVAGPGPEFGTSGGGVSGIFHVPRWQRHHDIPPSVNPGGHRGRGVPDIAGYASGYTIVYGGAAIPDVQGTSEAAPLYAGLVALLNAHLRHRVGFLNPVLYAHDLRHCFRDIADGRSNASFGAPGYICGPGWDACTGLGSIKGKTLLHALRRGQALVADAHGEHRFTGKVVELEYDRFGEFQSFVVVDRDGVQHRFHCQERQILRVVDRAWSDGITTTVLTRDDKARVPVAIVLGHP